MFIFDAFKCVRNHNLERRPLPGSSHVNARPRVRACMSDSHSRFTFTQVCMARTDGAAERGRGIT
jgi:hypothetical protein